MEQLASTIVTILAPYISAGATKAAEALGTSLAERAGALLNKLRDWFSGNDEHEAALRSFQSNPSRYGGVVEDIVRQKLEENPQFSTELTKALAEVGPTLEVIQKIEVLAGQATGLDLAKWRTGAAIARQEVKTVASGASLIGALVRS